jgi:hypothetical protein
MRAGAGKVLREAGQLFDIFMGAPPLSRFGRQGGGFDLLIVENQPKKAGNREPKGSAH